MPEPENRKLGPVVCSKSDQWSHVHPLPWALFAGKGTEEWSQTFLGRARRSRDSLTKSCMCRHEGTPGRPPAVGGGGVSPEGASV